MELETERREYLRDKLSRSSLKQSPYDQFDLWMADALAARVQDPTAMCVATVGKDGAPSQRIVLLKHFDINGFVFYTNLESRKAQDIASNPRVSLHFAWLEIDRQLHIEGTAEKLKLSTVLTYFLSRPRQSQLAAWASQQSRRISSRQVLEDEFLTMRRKFSDREVPLPSFWGGYRVIPDHWEFWQGRENRLHDRFQYSREGEQDWEISRVSP